MGRSRKGHIRKFLGRQREDRDMVELKIKEYENADQEKWDTFVMKQSVNGTFLQTKNFLDYHGDRFEDASLILYKGNDTLVAVIPACQLIENGRKIFSAHCGSTFGGIVMSEAFYNIEHMDAVLTILEKYLRHKGFMEVHIKPASDIFAKQSGNLLYYFLFQRGYTTFEELSCYIDFRDYKDDIASNFSSGRRRDYKYSLKNELSFKMLQTSSEIEAFYEILCGNLRKFDAKPVHTLEQMLEFKEHRLKDVVEFYGVFHEERMIAGSMVFLFGQAVFHTQYLAADQSCLKLFPMNFLDANLISTAHARGFRYFSFGTSTEDHGKILNKKLAEFKEGFGSCYGTNRTFVKEL